jgi:hypothetical protein
MPGGAIERPVGMLRLDIEEMTGKEGG